MPQTDTAHSIASNPSVGVNRTSVTQFLAALGLLIFATPFIDRPPYGEQIEGVVMTLVLLSGALAVGGRRKVLILAMSLCGLAVTFKWVQHFRPDFLPVAIVPAISLVFMGLLIWELTRFILRAPHVDREVVSAAIATYICMGLAWMFAYVLVAKISPNSFALFGQPVETPDPYDLFYFSYITLISIGYGDITPLSKVAKMLAVLEGITGMFFVVTLISRLVSMYSTSRPVRH